MITLIFGDQSDATGRVLALSDDGKSVVVSSYGRNNGEGAVGVYSLERDETSPQLLRAVLSKDHKSIILEFDESLEHSYTEKDQFTVDADNISGVAIDSVKIIGPFDSRVEISLINSITDPESVKVSYDDPTVGNDPDALQDNAGNDVSTFANEPANLDETPPQLTSAEVLRDGRYISLVFDEFLDPGDDTSLTSLFTVTADGRVISINTVHYAESEPPSDDLNGEPADEPAGVQAQYGYQDYIRPDEVIIELSDEIAKDEVVTIDYSDPSTGDDSALQDSYGNDVESFRTSAQNNSERDLTGPVLQAGAVASDGRTITLVYDEPLD